MDAQDLMSFPAVTCNVNDTLELAAKLMLEGNCGAIVAIREDGKLAGLLTDRDICMAAYARARPLEDMLVNGTMASHVVAARPDTPIAEIWRMMAAHRIRRIPIVDGEDRPIGLISLDDLAIESVQPDTQVPRPFGTLAHTFAAVCGSNGVARGAARRST